MVFITIGLFQNIFFENNLLFDVVQEMRYVRIDNKPEADSGGLWGHYLPKHQN